MARNLSHPPSKACATCVELSPTSLATLFDCEVEEIKKLLRPGRRRKVEAMARLRPLAILDATIQGEKAQPSDVDLKQIGEGILTGKTWTDVFKGASAVEISADGVGPNLSLRLSKKEGVPIQLVAEGTPGASVVAVKRVNELDFFSLGAKQLAAKLSLSLPKTIAVVEQSIRKTSDGAGFEPADLAVKATLKIQRLRQRRCREDTTLIDVIGRNGLPFWARVARVRPMASCSVATVILGF